MSDKIVIIDGNSLINRAYYAMQKPMVTREGIFTQGIFGFLNMLNKIMDEQKPVYIAVAWDRKAPTFRHESYTDYKAGRRSMPPELAMELPLMKDILEAMHIRNFETDGFEADDIIGTIARESEDAGLEPLVVTGDRDALQLVTDVTHVLITKKGVSEFELYDNDKMLERYEVTPTQFIDLKGLMGDSSDNIPGIPGVGEKTGIKLIKQFGSVAEILARTDEIANAKLRAKVEENYALAAMSRKLAEIVTNVPLDYDIEELRVREPDREKLIDIYKKLEFNKFLRALKVSDNEIASKPATEAGVEPYVYEILDKESDDLFKKIEDIPEKSEIGLKVFGNNDHVGIPRIDGIALAYKGSVLYIPFPLDGEKERSLAELLDSKKYRYVGHDLVTDYYMLRSIGVVSMDTAFDTQVAQYVIDPSTSSYDIKVLAAEYLGDVLRTEKEVYESGAQMDLLSDGNAPFACYACEMLRAVEMIRRHQEDTLAEAGTEKLCYEIEFPLIDVLASMEHEGVSVDVTVLDDIGELLTKEISALETEIYELAGEEFNINSPSQLGVILFEKLGLPAGKKTKKGYSTSADILEKLADKHPIIEKVLSYRTVTKLKGTYVDGLKPLIAKDGKIHAHFRQTVTATGRLSCTEPNLQNIPVRQELGRKLRGAFVAGEGNMLVGADYSQIELRILAHLSGDENLTAAFNNGEDIHRTTAARVFGKAYDEVTSLDRSRAKAVNFGVIYGMSGFGLSEEIHVTRKEAEGYIKDYFTKHPKVKAYMDNAVASCKANGYSETIFGRRRYIREIAASNFMVRQLGERLAMNSPIQGSAADLIKIAMLAVYREIKERGLRSRLILQIHDELIIRQESGEEDVIRELLVRNMENAAQLNVKLVCDANEAYSWYDLK